MTSLRTLFIFLFKPIESLCSEWESVLFLEYMFHGNHPNSLATLLNIQRKQMNEPLTRTIGGKLWRWNEARKGYDPAAVASKAQAAELKQAIRNESLAASRIPGCDKRRILLRISQFTRRRQDPDNCCPKYEIDAIRSLGIIGDDTDDDIELQIRQIQVTQEDNEGVLIEIL